MSADTGWQQASLDRVAAKAMKEAMKTLIAELPNKRPRDTVVVWGYAFGVTPEIPYGLVVHDPDLPEVAVRFFARRETLQTMIATTPEELMRTSELLSAMVRNKIQMTQLWADQGGWISSIVTAVARMVEEGGNRRDAQHLATMVRQAQEQLGEMNDQLAAALYVVESLLEHPAVKR